MNDTKARAVCGLVAASLALAPMTALAADFYAGVGFGQTKTKDYDDYVAQNFDDGSITSASFDDSDTGLRIFGGVTINPNFAVELGFLDLGEASTDAESDGCCFYAPGEVKHSASADGMELSAVARIPITEAAAIFGRLGVFNWDVSEKISDTTGGASGSDDGNDVFYALGGEYRFPSAFALRAEYAFYTVDATGGEFDISNLSAVAAYYFGSR